MATWRDVNANFSAGNQLLAQSGKQLGNAFTDFGGSLVDRDLKNRQLEETAKRTQLLQDRGAREQALYDAGLAADAQRGDLAIDPTGQIVTPEQTIPLTDQQHIARAREVEGQANALDTELRNKYLQDQGADLRADKQSFSKLTGIGEDPLEGRPEDKALLKRLTGIDIDENLKGEITYRAPTKEDSANIDKEFNARMAEFTSSIDGKYQPTKLPASTTKGGLKGIEEYTRELRTKANKLGKGKSEAEKQGLNILLKERLAAHEGLISAQAAADIKRAEVDYGWGKKEDLAAFKTVLKNRTEGNFRKGDVSPKDVAKAKAYKAYIDSSITADDDSPEYAEAEAIIKLGYEQDTRNKEGIIPYNKGCTLWTK